MRVSAAASTKTAARTSHPHVHCKINPTKASAATLLPAVYLNRRSILLSIPLTTLASAPKPSHAESNTNKTVVVQGIGTSPVQLSDIVMIHYKGILVETGQVFDGTLGEGLTYRDGGKAANRPLVFRIGGDPVPGVCAGLEEAILGMKVGEKVVVEIDDPDQGFGQQPVLAPFAVVPANSRLRYEVELVRLSRRGPDALLSGVKDCGGGFVMERTKGCGDVSVAEYL